MSKRPMFVLKQPMIDLKRPMFPKVADFSQKVADVPSPYSPTLSAKLNIGHFRPFRLSHEFCPVRNQITAAFDI